MELNSAKIRPLALNAQVVRGSKDIGSAENILLRILSELTTANGMAAYGAGSVSNETP
jgi:hypothetical protein